MIIKEDIPVLIHLLNKFINSEDEQINCNSLAEFSENSGNNEELENKFRYFANIFRVYEVGEYFDNGFGCVVIRQKPNMYTFDFEKEYNNQVKKAEKDAIELEKSLLDIRLKKWQLKIFWWIFGFAIIGSGLSVYNFINSLMPSKDVKEQEEKITRMESELSKMRTLVLDQKKVDSLRNSNSYKKE